MAAKKDLEISHLYENVNLRRYTSPISGETIYGDHNALAEFLADLFSDRFAVGTGVVLDSYTPFINLRHAPGIGFHYAAGSHYLEKCLLGKGAFGTVCKCVDIKSGVDFAMKKLKHEKITDKKSKDYMSLEREVRSLLLSNHPSIIKLLGLIKRNDAVHVLLENGGLSLDVHLSRVIPVKLDILWWFCQLLHGVRYIHSRGVVHCDFHLGNILLHNNVIKICDFGSAKSPGDKLFTYSHGNTPAYFPPTVLKCILNDQQVIVAPRLDTFATGKILLEVVTDNLISIKDMKPYILEKSQWDQFVKQHKHIHERTCISIRQLITGLMSFTTKDGISTDEAIEIIEKALAANDFNK